MFFDVLQPFRSTSFLGIADAALLIVFRNRSELETFLQFEFGKNLEHISPPSDTLPKALEKVLLKANEDGDFVELITKAQARFPDNQRFQLECQKALGEKRTEEGEDGVPIAEQAHSPRLLRNRKLLVLFVGVAMLWSGLVMGLDVPLAVLGASGTLWAGVVALYTQVPWLGGRIDRWLVRQLNHPWTSAALIGPLILGTGASLFVGSLVIEQGAVRSYSVTADFPSDRAESRLISTAKRHYFLTTPWSGREVRLRLDGVLPYPRTICPWRTTRVWLDEFEPAPYVLLIPSLVSIEEIFLSKPWKVTIRVEPGGTTHELLSYVGEPILVGRTLDPPECITPEGTIHEGAIIRMSSARASQHPVPSCSDAKPDGVFFSTVDPPIELEPGMKLLVEWKHPTNQNKMYCDTFTVERSESAGAALVHTLKPNPCR